MSGLYQRALDYLQSQGSLRLVGPDDVDYDELPGTPDERAQIETEIRYAAVQHRIPIGPDTFRINPKRRGIRLPLFVNVVAVILIVTGVVFLTRLLDREEHSLVARTGSLASAEGRLLSALRQESAARISEKEREIAEIERQLAQVEAEREQIRSEAQARLETRESELRAEFEAALEAERVRLAAQNLTDSERAELLAAFRGQRQAELEQNIAQMERDALVELRAREDALAALAGEYESILDATLAQREALEAQLQAEIRRREAELSGERAAAARQLDELRAQHDQRQLVLDQILGFYSQVRDSLGRGSYEETTRHLASLREYLNTAPVSSMPELQRRRGVELFLVSTLEDRVARARSAGSAETQLLVESASMISRVGTLIEAGNELYHAGAYEEAVATYEEALASLPAADDRLVARLLDSGYRLLAADTLAEQAGEIVDLQTRLDRTDEELRVEQARRTGLVTELRGTTAELEATSAREGALQNRLREQRDLATGIDAYRTAFGTIAAQADGAPSVSALELLETKLLIFRIVGSESIRADHPDLADELNAYLDGLVAEQRTSAARAVLRELTVLLDDLTARIDGSAATAREVVRSYPNLGDPELSGATDGLLSRLREIAETPDR